MNFREAAEKYLQRGWSVIPISPKAKTPFIKWVGYADKRAEWLDLQAWFAGQNNNVAIVTGQISGLVVIDIDKPELFADYQAKYPTGLISRTPRGGYHLFYAYDGDDIGNSVSRLASGIDVRGRHGYVLAAPSFVDYGNGTSGSYTWESFNEPAPLPAQLREQILAELRAVKTDTVNGGAKAEDGHELWLRVLTHGFTEGQHNNEAKDVARYLFRQGFSEDGIINTLSAKNAQDATPLPQHELLATIRSGIGYERKRLDGKEKPVEEKKDFDAMPLVEVASMYDNFYEKWLIQDWLPEDSILMVSAPPESYKTWLLLDAAISVALGKDAAPFMGQFNVMNDPQPVFIVQQEDYMGQLMGRVRAIQRAKSMDIRYPVMGLKNGMFIDPMQGNQPDTLIFGSSWLAPIYVHTQSALSFDDEESLDKLEEKINSLGIKLVVIDPFYMLAEADDFFAGAARKMARIKEMRRKYGTAFLFAHHNRKGGGSGREQIFGSQLLNGAVEGVWLIYGFDGQKDNQRRIKKQGKSFTDQKTYNITFDIGKLTAEPTPGLEVVDEFVPIYAKDKPVEVTRYVQDVHATDTNYNIVVEEYKERATANDNEEELLQFIRENPNYGTTSDIALAMGLSKTTIDRAKNGLLEKQLIVQLGSKGKGFTYAVPVDVPPGT